MRSTIISLIILIATSGCWATIPIPYLQFGVPQPQQFFYKPPQRQFPSQPFFPNYEPFRYPQMYAQTQLYTPPHPFVPSQPFAHAQAYPFNFYNNPQTVPRDVFPSIYADNYDPILQYYHRQLPLHPFAPYPRKPLLLQRPMVHDVLADCDNSEHQKTESETTQNHMEPQAMTEQVRRTSAASETKSPSSEPQTTPLKPANPLETLAEEVSTKSPNPEPQTTTLNSAVSPDDVSGEGVLQSRILQLKSNDSEPQQSIEIAATKESKPNANATTSTETKTTAEEETLPKEVQDVTDLLNDGDKMEIPRL